MRACWCHRDDLILYGYIYRDMFSESSVCVYISQIPPVQYSQLNARLKPWCQIPLDKTAWTRLLSSTPILIHDDKS